MMSDWKSSSQRRSLSSAVLLVLMASPAIADGAVYTDLFEFDCAKNGCNGGQPGSGIVYVLDATGRKIAVIYCSQDEKISVAEFICAASEQRFNSNKP